MRAGGHPPGLRPRPLLVDPVERVGQLGKVAVAVDTVEALLGRQHSRSGPSQAHRRVPLARDVPQALAITEFIDSMMFVKASNLRNSFGNPGRVSVSVFGVPSRTDLTAPGQMSSCFDGRFSTGTRETASPYFLDFKIGQDISRLVLWSA